jgi:hypothetical protein
VVVVASLDADEKQCQFSRDDTTLTTVIETFDVESSQEIELAASEADYPLEKGKITTGRYLYIETDKELMIKLDGEAVGHKIGIPAAGTKAKFLLRGTFTAAPLITNNEAQVAAVSYFMAGDK